MIVVQVCDSGLPTPGTCSTDTLTIDVNSGTAFVAVNDTVTTNEGTNATIYVLTNDIGNINPATVDLDTSAAGIQNTLVIPGKGTVTVDINGVVTFMPEAGFTGTVVIPYTVNDIYGVTSNVANIILLVNSENGTIVVPQLLTPNGDGLNETFIIEGAEGKTVHLFIYNRWGNLVYSSESYQNDWDGNVIAAQDNDEKTKVKAWGGTNRLPDGTYFYVIEIDSMIYKKAGYLELRR